MQIKRVDGKGCALCGNERVDAKGGMMMCEFKGQMDKSEYYDVEMKGWL